MRAETPQRAGKEATGSRHEPGGVRQTVPAAAEPIGPPPQPLREEVLRRENLTTAFNRLQANQGAPGIEGMTVEELPASLRKAWPSMREQLLNAIYAPAPVRTVALPKPGGGTRRRGMPTVLDRFIAQAILQVLGPLFDPDFSPHSYGFRPGRNAHQALQPMCHAIEEGDRWVVNLALEKFFDRVNHDMVMRRVARKVKDQRLLKLLRRYLTAGSMQDGLVSQREAGMPQGRPRSPLLSHVLLDDFDQELERRGHRFCRYADDGAPRRRGKEAAMVT